MFQDLPRYGAYKAAGEWVAEVPVSWSWEPGRMVFAERKDAGHAEEQLLSVTIGRGVIPQVDLLSSTSKKDSSNVDKSKYKLVEPGDLVYNKMRAWQGAAGSSKARGIVSPAYVVMTPREAVAEYMHEVVRTPQFAKEAERWSYGITSDQWSLRPEHFKMIRFPLPPAEEQKTIVKYLAHANARIDKAIAAKRRLIALLREEADARRARLLVGLGQPQRLANAIWEGPTNGKSPEVSERGDLESLSISVVRNGIVDVRESDIKYVARSSVSDADKYNLRFGDVLIVRGNGNIKLVGRCGLVVSDMPDRIYPDLLMRLRFRSAVDPRFMAIALNSPTVRVQIENSARTAVGTFKLSGADVRSLRIPIPPISLQREIVAEEQEISSVCLSTTRKLEQEIALLHEFRSRLVADVVTGQVDVRAIADGLPDAPEAVIDLADESSEELSGVIEDADA